MAVMALSGVSGAGRSYLHEIIYTTMRVKSGSRNYPVGYEKIARVIADLISCDGWASRQEVINRIEAAIAWHEALWRQRGLM